MSHRLALKIALLPFFIGLVALQAAPAQAQRVPEVCAGTKSIDALARISSNARIENYVRKLFHIPPLGSVRAPEGCTEDFTLETVATLEADLTHCSRAIVKRNKGYHCPRPVQPDDFHYAVLEVNPRNGGLFVVADEMTLDDPRFWPERPQRPGKGLPEKSVTASLPFDADQDNDGIANGYDLCLFRPENKNGLLDDDGCPDDDLDGDGIADVLDVCPSQRETINGFQENDGCPDLIGKSLSELSRRILFMSGSSKLATSSRRALTEAAFTLLKHTGRFKVVISGFAKRRTTAEAAQTLSQQRANALKEALVEARVDGERLIALGRGDALPSEALDSPDGTRHPLLNVVRLQGADSGAGAEESALSPFIGDYPLEHLTLSVAPSITDCHATISKGAPAWLGSEGSRASCYSASVEGQRIAVHLRGSQREFSVVLYHADGRYRGVTHGGGHLKGQPRLAFAGRREAQTP